jgi:hypothetical protein
MEGIMEQDKLADEFAPDPPESKNSDEGRVLTHDEKKAAEAAFQGEPFNPAWSVSAAHVYAGIRSAMGKQEASQDAACDRAEDCIVGQ